MLRVIYKKNRTEPAVFSKLNRNRTELEKSIPHIPNINHDNDLMTPANIYIE